MPSVLDLSRHASEIRRIAARHGVGEVMVFGSTARGEALPDSDLDLLIKVTGPTTPWFPGGLVAELEEALGRRVDVAEERSLDPLIRDAVLREAAPCEPGQALPPHIAQKKESKGNSARLGELIDLIGPIDRRRSTAPHRILGASGWERSLRPGLRWSQLASTSDPTEAHEEHSCQPHSCRTPRACHSRHSRREGDFGC